MRIHLVSAVFPPEPLTSAQTTRDIAVELTRRGHETTVFSPHPNRPTGELWGGARRSLRTRVEHRDGLRVVHSWHTLSRRSSLVSRAAENLSFGLTSTWRLLREPAADVAYLNTWPLLAQSLASWALSRRRVPIVCAVHDLYPESFGARGSGALMRPLRRLDARVYGRSHLVTALSESQAETLARARGVPREKLAVVPDWVDGSRFPRNAPRDGRFRREHGFGRDDFLALYVGSLTRTAGLSVYLEAADALRARRDVRIALVGRGSEAGALRGAIRARGLRNLHLVEALAPDDVPEVQAAADALLLSLAPGAAELTTPSKLVFYLFSGRPVLANVSASGPAAQVLTKADCGRVILPGDGKSLADLLVQMADASPAESARLGSNARRCADEHFERERLLPRVCELIERVGRGEKRGKNHGA